MIRITRAKNESRNRDKKRYRVILEIGEVEFHLTREEAANMKSQLNRFKF